MGESMMTELLIVKTGDSYIRFTEGGFEQCSMSKGSVFPLSEIKEVKKKCVNLARDVSNVQLMKLTICEEPFVE